MALSIRLATEASDLEACMALRWEVFVEEQGVAAHEEQDGQDHLCQHVLARLDGQAVGAARFKQIDDYVKIQRVCVPKQHRRKSIGADMMRFIGQEAKRSASARFAILGAQTHAMAFYQKLGFEEEGQVYMDAGIPHMDMRLNLQDR